MDKQSVLEALLERLRAELEATRRASREAAAHATDEESRARSKWETQGLEASYLAAGQAGKARALADALQRVQGSRSELLAPRAEGAVGALLGCSLGGVTDWYFLAPAGGGETLRVQDREVTVITPGSPLFSALRGKRAGQRAQLPSGASLEIVEVR